MAGPVVIVQGIFKKGLKRNAELLHIMLVEDRERGDSRYYEGVLVIDGLGDELFSARSFDLSDYCPRVHGTAYIMNVEVGEGTVVEFLAEDATWG